MKELKEIELKNLIYEVLESVLNINQQLYNSNKFRNIEEFRDKLLFDSTSEIFQLLQREKIL